MKTVSVIVPVYYNEGSLAPLFDELTRVEEQIAAMDCCLELVFVDDGSGDDSLAELLKIKQRRGDVKIVKLARNFGAFEASKVGLRFISGDCFMWLSADLQDPPELIPSMVEKWLAGSKFVIYARDGRDDPFLQKLFGGIYYWLLRRLVVPNYPTGGFDLALMDKVLLPHLRDSGKNINTTLLEYWLGFKPEVLRYRRREREHGQSMWTLSKRFKLALDTFLGFSFVPIRLITGIGLSVSFISMIYGMVTTAYAWFGVRGAPGWPTLVALITFLIGLVIVMLGIIGEYVWRIYDEVNKVPEVVIDEVF
ncbi:MAG: glycosyltransferase family 2 protein [bacterium]|nr:glycosyltransferase family 2 protein [bacterium]